MEINESNIKAAYEVADENTKRVLDALFGTQMAAKDEAEAKPTPTLDDYKTITSYEDACVALGITPIASSKEDDEMTVVSLQTTELLPTHLVALYKLEIISRALWGREWQPQPDAEGNNIMWYPWFALYASGEINSSVIDRGCLLAAGAYYGAYAGFGYLAADDRSSYSGAGIGFRLCQETEEKAAYFAKQFLELWAEYLAFNFTTGERLK